MTEEQIDRLLALTEVAVASQSQAVLLAYEALAANREAMQMIKRLLLDDDGEIDTEVEELPSLTIREDGSYEVVGGDDDA